MSPTYFMNHRTNGVRTPLAHWRLYALVTRANAQLTNGSGSGMLHVRRKNTGYREWDEWRLLTIGSTLSVEVR